MLHILQLTFLFFVFARDLSTNYELDIIFERVDAKLWHYFLQLFLFFLDAMAELTRESMGLLGRLAELRDYLIRLLRLRREKLKSIIFKC